MSNADQWPYRWFGVWAEYGTVYAKCPSAISFVVPATNAKYEKAKLRAYLTSAPVVASTSRRNFPNPFTGERAAGSVSFRTDGKWLWLDDLADYVDHHAVTLPDAWLAEIEERNYIPPESVADEVVAQLEWPPTA